jgi:hypothetical protein
MRLYADDRDFWFHLRPNACYVVSHQYSLLRVSLDRTSTTAARIHGRSILLSAFPSSFSHHALSRAGRQISRERSQHMPALHMPALHMPALHMPALHYCHDRCQTSLCFQPECSCSFHELLALIGSSTSSRPAFSATTLNALLTPAATPPRKAVVMLPFYSPTPVLLLAIPARIDRSRRSCDNCCPLS